MKLTHVSIDSILGVQHVDTPISKAINVFAGSNFAGKSSIREAVKLALIGQPERILKKKEYDQIVHLGYESGAVAVDFEGGNAYFTAPDGKQGLTHSDTMDVFILKDMALPYCLEIDTFAHASDDERRGLLFILTGATAKAENIVKRLVDKGVTVATVETIKPMLRSGFPAAAEFAKGKARDAKSAWKAITNETWGSLKAEGWKADAPEFDQVEIDHLTAAVEDLDHKIGTEQTKLGAAEQKLQHYLQHSHDREKHVKAVASLPSLEKKLDHDQDDLTAWNDKVTILEQQAGTGPRIGLVHDLAACLAQAYEAVYTSMPELAAQIDLALEPYEKQYGTVDSGGDPEAAAKLPEAIKARDLMQRAVDNTKRDIDAAKAAQLVLSEQIEVVRPETVEAIKSIVLGHKQKRTETKTALDALLVGKRAAEQAAARTTQAATHHENVKQWTLAGDALSPDGIPAEILNDALSPFNALLAKVSDTFGWPVVAIDRDMLITAGGRIYALLSQSEQWRTDAVIALAIANISNLKLVAFDRFDVLNLTGRDEFLDGIDLLAEGGFIDTGLVFGTMKQRPDLSAFPQIATFWVENGAIAGQAAKIKEAA